MAGNDVPLLPMLIFSVVLIFSVHRLVRYLLRPHQPQVPVTILTGFLGSGKTTLLNHILTKQHGKKIAVIENEFGDVGIDDALLKDNIKEHSGEDVIEMMNGCICCTVRQDLVEVLKKLAMRTKYGGAKLDAIVIETTGLADPAPVAQTFFVDAEVTAFCKLDGIVTLVDAKHISQHLDEEKPEGVENEAVEQVAFADRLILNKVDLVPDEAELAAVEEKLRAINKFAPVIRSTQSKVSVEQVLNIGAFDLQRTLHMDPEFLNIDGEHEHDTSVTSIGIDIPGDVNLSVLQDWFGKVLQEKATDIYRMKGILAIENESDKYQYHAVHMIFNGTFAEKWGPNERRGCKLTFIGKNLNHEELRTGSYACMATEENYQKRLGNLRFKIGDLVECRTKVDWASGKVVERLWKSPSGRVVPYQVELTDGDHKGELIYAPADDNELIRRLGKREAQKSAKR